MNALTTWRPGSGALALLPTNMRDALEMATLMAKAGFLPRELQSPGAALFVVEQAMRWQMSPYAVATEISFPQGKPMFSGKLVAAAVQSSGAIQGRLHYAYTGSGDDRTITVSGTLRGDAEPVSVTVRLCDCTGSHGPRHIPGGSDRLRRHGKRPGKAFQGQGSPEPQSALLRRSAESGGSAHLCRQRHSVPREPTPQGP